MKAEQDLRFYDYEDMPAYRIGDVGMGTVFHKGGPGTMSGVKLSFYATRISREKFAAMLEAIGQPMPSSFT